MRKKRKANTIYWIFFILIFIITFCETELFYWDIVSTRVYLIFLGIMNGLRVFAFRSTLDMFSVINAGGDQLGLVRNIFDNLYILCYFGAPVVTFKYIFDIVSGCNFFRRFKKERLVIVGYNRHVEILVNDILKSGHKESVVILHKGEIPKNEKRKLCWSGVVFLEYSKLDFDDVNERKTILKLLVPKRVKHIILFEENDMDNFANYCFFIRCFKEKNHSGFWQGDEEKSLRIDCNYNLPQVEELIWNYFDEKKINNFKYRMNTFSLPMLRAQAVLDNYKVYENIIEAQGECKDIHLVIIGFGKMGKRFLKRAINQSIVSEKNNILVDIIEKDFEKAKWYLKGQCKTFYNDEENTIHIDSKIVEGDLKIRLHKCDINDILFEDCLQSISKEKELTYVAICIDNPEESIKCMLYVEDYLKEMNVPVLMRMDYGQQLKELNSFYENLHLVPGDDDILSIDKICSEKLDEISKNIHKNDNKQQDRTKYAYQVESRKYRELHYETKERLSTVFSDSDKAHIKNIFDSKEDTEKSSRKEFIDKIENDEILFKLGAIEHRRWSYYTILNGWKYGKDKSERKKETPYLCPFRDILDDTVLKASAYYEYKDWHEIFTKSETNKGENIWRTQRGKKSEKLI